jgi:pilus assembly protein CpaE
VIVVDTSPFFHGPMLATLDRTDELVVLCGLDVPTLKNVRLALQTLELLSFPVNRIRFVLNRANSKVGLSKREVEAALEVTISNEIPSERIVPLSVNRGTPAVLSDPGSDYAKSVLQIAKAVLATPATAKAAKGATAKRRKLSLSRS